MALSKIKMNALKQQHEDAVRERDAVALLLDAEGDAEQTHANVEAELEKWNAVVGAMQRVLGTVATPEKAEGGK